MKIRLVIREFWPLKGGLTLHALRLAQEMGKRGHEFEVITPFIENRPGGNNRFWATERTRTVEIEGVRVHILGLNLLERLFLLPLKKIQWRKSTQALAKKMLSFVYRRHYIRLFEGVDLVHYDGAGMEFLGFAVANVTKELGIPLVIQPSVHLGQWGHLPVDHDFFRLGDALLAHSLVETRYLQQLLEDRIPVYTVYNGIDEIERGDAAGFRERYEIHGWMILFLGRKTEDKGYFLLRDAFAEIKNRVPSAHLVCVGPGEGLPAESSVTELGYVSDQERADALAACDVLAVPSEGESFGLVFLEAGRARKPFIARDLELFEDLLGPNGAAGLRIGERKVDGTVQLDAGTLATALADLLDDSDSRKKMGEFGFHNAERFLWSTIVVRFEEAYQMTLDRFAEA